MFKALVLIRNLESGANHLDFGEFTVEPVGLRFKELREVFSSVDVNRDDWIFEKSYTVPPAGPPGSAVGGIPNDIEDILLLLRLYKAGDIAFVKQAILQPSGIRTVQFPYRAMNDLNSYSAIRFQFQSDECETWKAFAKGIRESQSWTSEWFAVARRFFLLGGAKEFNPQWDDVDRIVDYATALEATLMFEDDLITRRISRRAGRLVSTGNAKETDDVTSLIKKFYGMRSGIVHGSKLSARDRQWLIQNCAEVEQRVRQVLTSAVQKLPADETSRRAALIQIYDASDDDRGSEALQKFKRIKTSEVREQITVEILKLFRQSPFRLLRLVWRALFTKSRTT
jgi:hypothetical protein